MDHAAELSPRSTLVVDTEKRSILPASLRNVEPGKSQTELISPVNEPTPQVTNLPKECVLNNYFSIGMDGRICLDFHNFRNRNPELFKNKFINYGWYGAIGLKSAITHWTALSRILSLKIDGNSWLLPNKLLAIVVLNIPSYGGGADLWGKEKKNFKKQAIDDGIFEVVGIRGAFHMGKIQSGMAKGEKLAQGRRVEITVVSEIEAQVDGEPFIIPPSKIVVEHHNQAPVVINSLKDKYGRQQVRLTTSESKVSRHDLERFRQELLSRLEDCQIKSPSYQDELTAIQSYIKRVHDPLSLLELLEDRISALTIPPKVEIPPKPKKKTIETHSTKTHRQ